MAAATWPASLPQELNIDSVEGELPTGAVRADTDSGPAFQRQRFTAAPEPFTGVIWIDGTQYATLLSFWRDTLAHGALAFDWKHPITEASAELQFQVGSPPRIRAKSGTLFEVDMTLEILP